MTVFKNVNITEKGPEIVKSFIDFVIVGEKTRLAQDQIGNVDNI